MALKSIFAAARAFTPEDPGVVESSTAATAAEPGDSVAVATSSGALVAANTARRYLVVFNTGSVDVWLSLGGTAVVGSGIYLPPDGGWEMPAGVVYTGAVNAISDGSASTVAVTEI